MDSIKEENTLSDPDVNLHVKKIRKLAADYQSGGDLNGAKASVDALIQDIRDSLGNNREHQLRMWSGLLHELTLYNTNMSDPRWIDVMAHARNRIKSRRNSVNNFIKRGMN